MRTTPNITAKQHRMRACVLGLLFILPAHALAQSPPSRDPAATETAPPQDATVNMDEESFETGQMLRLEEAYQLALSNEEQVKIAAHELAKSELLPWRAVTWAISCAMTEANSLSASVKTIKPELTPI